MILTYKSYCFRLKPTKAQRQALDQFADARRWVWNWALQRRIDHYKQTKKIFSYIKLSAELTQLRRQPETNWLKQAPLDILQQSLIDLNKAFVKFFRKKAKFPKFKSKKKSTHSFRIPQYNKVQGDVIHAVKVGWIKFKKSRPIIEKIKSATYKKDSTNNWFVSIVTEFELPNAIVKPDTTKVVGIDIGLTRFATLSDGENVENPRFYKQGQRKLRKLQKVLTRRKKGSNRRNKARLRVAHRHRRIANQRKDFLHKLTTKIINEHDCTCVEDLNLKALARTKLGKSFLDASHSEFRRQLTYKSEWARKPLNVVSGWFPSSKTCNNCGHVNKDLKLKDRVWTCPNCCRNNHRDANASDNIRDQGLRILAAGFAERQNARGEDIRLLDREANLDETRILVRNN